MIQKGKNQMKTSKKLISVLLAVIMIVGTMQTAFAGPLAKYNTVDKIITQENIVNIAGDLISGVNNRKTAIIGTVLRLVFLFVKDDSLQAQIGTQDVVSLPDEKLATILVNWLNANLPEWTKDFTSSDAYKKIIEGLMNKFPGIEVNLKSVNGVLDTLVTVENIKDLVGGTIKDKYKVNSIGRKSGTKYVKKVETGTDAQNLDVIYALIGFLNDNIPLLKDVANGKLDLGLIDTFAKGTSDKVTKKVNEFLSKDNIMDQIYKLVDGHAAKGDFAKSAYASYTADQLIAAGLIRMIRNVDPKTDIISKEDCNAALELNFYGLLAKYGPELLKNLRLKDGSSLVEKLNSVFGDLINKLKAQDINQSIKDRFNFTAFSDDDFNAVFAKMNTEGILNQFNDICCLIAKHILSDASYKELGLVNGDNTKLNDNFTKIFRYTLPALAEIGDIGGFDFSKFNKEAVASMSLPEMGAAILKIFFPTWFKANFDEQAKAAVNNAVTIDQLAVIAAKLALTNDSWIKFELTEPDKADYNKIVKYNSVECKEAILMMGAEVAALALDYNKKTTHYNLPENRDGWTYNDYLNSIVNWAVGFIKGIPSVVAKDEHFNKQDAFYKINVVLNELADFSFIDAGDATFVLDIETLLFDKLLGNLFKLDFAGLLGTFEKNTNAGNLLNKKIIPAVISILDRLLSSALSEHVCVQVTGSGTESLGNCKYCRYTCTYCKGNGHYMGKGKVDEAPYEKHNDSWVIITPASCATGTKGTRHRVCADCGKETKGVETYSQNHTFNKLIKTIPATTESNAIEVYQCANCTATINREKEGTMLKPQKLTVKVAPHIKVKSSGLVVADISVKAKDLLASSNGTKVLDAKGNEVKGNEQLGTGMKLVLIVNGKIIDTKVIAVMGDIDGNGNISVTDARLVLRAAVSLEKYTGAQFTACNIGFNGAISVNDARSVLRAAVSLESPKAWLAKFADK